MVVKRSRTEDYCDSYPSFRLEKSDDKILLFQLHTNGHEFVWDGRTHGQFADACADIAGDRDIHCVIFTGTGDSFMDKYGSTDGADLPVHTDMGAEVVDLLGWRGRQRHLNLLDIQVPVIAAINGPCSIHSELPVMCDIVLASEDAYLQDSAHFPRGIPPGDGVHTIWPRVIGHNRARYFLLTGQKLSAQEALSFGAVNEVLPKTELMDRAWELARYLVMRPPLTLRATRAILVQRFKRAAADELMLGQFQELFGMRNFYPQRGGKEPLDRAWDDDPWGAPVATKETDPDATN